MIEATNTTDLGLIKDATNPLARQAKRGVDMYWQSGKTEIDESTETSEQTESTQTFHTAGTPSAPHVV